MHGRFLPKRKYKDRAEFFAALKDAKAVKIERVDVTEIDVLMLRNDPSIDVQTPWAMEAGILFGREAVRGTVGLTIQCGRVGGAWRTSAAISEAVNREDCGRRPRTLNSGPASWTMMSP